MFLHHLGGRRIQCYVPSIHPSHHNPSCYRHILMLHRFLSKSSKIKKLKNLLGIALSLMFSDWYYVYVMLCIQKHFLCLKFYLQWISSSPDLVFQNEAKLVLSEVNSNVGTKLLILMFGCKNAKLQDFNETPFQCILQLLSI